MDISAALMGLYTILAIATLTWLISIKIRDVSIVDSIWSLMFLGAAATWLILSDYSSARNLIIMALVMAWSLRLSIYLTWRNHGKPEDRRYQAIREKYEPNFAIKSLFIIFLFQAVLAWIISLPLLPALSSPTAFGLIDGIALGIWATGFAFEAIGDWQLAQFKKDEANQGKVLDTGVWRYTRHPNYFGECLIWWSFFLFAVSTDAWWTIISPILMTWLLLKFSGVSLLESDITERRPAYRDYIKRTNAFIPGIPRSNKLSGAES